jgi:hypothetical protein
MRIELWFGLMLALVAAAQWLDCGEPAQTKAEGEPVANGAGQDRVQDQGPLGREPRRSRAS